MLSSIGKSIKYIIYQSIISTRYVIYRIWKVKPKKCCTTYIFFSKRHAICRNKIEFPTIDHECVLAHAKISLGSRFYMFELEEEARTNIKQNCITVSSWLSMCVSLPFCIPIGFTLKPRPLNKNERRFI